MPATALPRPSAFLPPVGRRALPGRVQLELTGRDRASFLHSFCTNDVKALQPGQGCEAFLTNIKGRILGHLFIFADDDRLTIDSGPGSADSIVPHLQRYLVAEDVEIMDRTGERAALAVFGPLAAERIAGVCGPATAALSDRAHVSCQRDGVTLVVRRLDFTTSPGFEIVVASQDLDEIGRALDQAGVALVTESDFEAFRIDAGFPRYGVDITEDHLAQEASRTRRAVSFTKGCYLGQEPIARIDALGHVNRQLRLLVGTDDEPIDFTPGPGVAALDSGPDLGTLTSAGRLADSAPVGLAMLRISASVGSTVLVPTSRGPRAATVLSLE